MAKKKPYRFVLYLFVRAGAWLVFILPRGWALFLAERGSRLGYRFVGRQRRKTLENLRRAYGPQKSQAELEKLAKRVFENFALTGVELLQFKKLNFEKVSGFVDFGDAFKVYDSLLAEGKGLISVTAHIGNWELLAAIFGLKGYRGSVLARRIYYEPYNRWVVGLRAALNVPTTYRDDSSREILKRLSNGEIIGLLPDQDIDSLKGVFVDFFGRPAYTPVAPVRLALTTGAPVQPNFMIRVGRDRYKLVLGKVIRPKVDTSREDAVKKYTQEWMSQFEEVIRAYPEQWAWMHNRWKTQPDVILRPKAEESTNQILRYAQDDRGELS